MRRADWKSSESTENILSTKIQTRSKDGIRKSVIKITSRVDISKTSTIINKWERIGIGVTLEEICKSARYIMKQKTDNKTKERALRLNCSAYLPIKSLIKLGFT